MQAMKQVLGIRDEKTRIMKVTPPLAVVPITQEDDIMLSTLQCDGTKVLQ